MAEEIKAEAVATEVKKGVELLSVNTVVPSVYLTGQYSSSAEAKANELTALMQKLVASGIWESAVDAAKRGVPAGTFIIVDSKETPETDFKVEVVPYIQERNTNNEVVEAPKQA